MTATTAEFRTGTLDPDEMIAAAREATGLTEFGAPDVRGPLKALCDSINTESNIKPDGEARRRAALVGALMNRLKLNDAITRHPEIEQEKIVKPIIVIGMSRSGTTKLQRVLAAGPDVQSLPLWRLQRPFPIAEKKAGEPDPRIALTQAFVDQKRTEAPDEYAAHPMYAEQADEEVYAMEMAFLANINATAYTAPSFDRWINEQDFEPWYVWFKRFLQYVQWEDGTAGKHFVLKAPHHLGFMPLVFKYFPDAVVVHTHRDPSTAVASFASLAQAARAANQYTADKNQTGRYILDYMAMRLRVYTADRATVGHEDQFVDLSYKKVVTDAVNIVEKVYAKAGVPFNETTVKAIKAWEAEFEQHKHGGHSYSLEEFGLTQDEADRLFKGYMERFAEFV